jgi:DNA-binding LytR/AlgR family response regulator
MSETTYRCLIVDDEPEAHEVLKAHMALVSSLQWAGSCYNGIEALDALHQKSIDLLFLDIQMPQLLGTDLLKTLPSHPRTILVTAHREFAIGGYDLGVVDYLLKPVSFERFLKAINKAIPIIGPEATTTAGQAGKYLYFRVNRKMVKVWLRDILFAESLKDYVKLVTKNGSLITKVSLTGLIDMLPEDEFIQVHRSFIVGISHVDAYTSENLRIMKTDIPVGPLYRNLLRSRMQELRWP